MSSTRTSRARPDVVKAIARLTVTGLTWLLVSGQVANAGCASGHREQVVDAAWARFQSSPSSANAETVASALDRGERVTAPMDLGVLDSEVQSGNRGAIHLAFAIHAGYGAHLSEEGGIVAGHGIRADPRVFLEFLALYRARLRNVGGVCANFGESFVDQSDEESAEATRRIDALSKAMGAKTTDSSSECLDSLRRLVNEEGSR